MWRSEQLIEQFPEDADHVTTLLNMYVDPSLAPQDSIGRPTMRSLGAGGGNTGGGRYNMDAYLRERGDENIRSTTDLIEKANFWDDPVIENRKENLQRSDSARTVASAGTLQTRFAIQTIVLQTFAELGLDAVIYPTGSVPPAIITNPEEPRKADRPPSIWAYINRQGFPAMTVPAGFTTQVYDRVGDPDDAENSQLVGPVAASLPVGIDFLARPFGEPMLFRIASAYEASTRHRKPPPDFGPLAPR